MFFDVFGAPGPVPRPSPGREIKLPVPNFFFGCVFAELLVLVTFVALFEGFGKPFFDF